MSDHDPNSEKPVSAPQGGRAWRRRAYIAVAIAGAALVGAFAGSPAGMGLGHRVLANVAGMTADAATFEGGFGPGFAADWRSDLVNGAIEAVVETRADRMIRHLAIEIDANAEQQDKLRAVVRGAVKDLLPLREKVVAARSTARELLTQQTIDRDAIEKFRADQIAMHDAASKRIVQAVADAADALTPEQRRKIGDMLPPRRGPGGWHRGPGRRLLAQLGADSDRVDHPAALSRRPRTTIGVGRDEPVGRNNPPASRVKPTGTIVPGRREAASPEPITTTGSMDSGLACFARAPGMTPQYF